MASPFRWQRLERTLGPGVPCQRRAGPGTHINISDRTRTGAAPAEPDRLLGLDPWCGGLRVLFGGPSLAATADRDKGALDGEAEEEAAQNEPQYIQLALLRRHGARQRGGGSGVDGRGNHRCFCVHRAGCPVDGTSIKYLQPYTVYVNSYRSFKNYDWILS